MKNRLNRASRPRPESPGRRLRARLLTLSLAAVSIALPGLLLTQTAGVAWAAPPDSLSPFEIVYDAKANGFAVGTVELELRSEGKGEYVYRQKSSTKGLGSLFGSNDLVETSRVRYEEGALRVTEYRSQRKGGDDEENARFLFDASKGKVLSRGAGSAWDLPYEKNIIDPLVVRLALMVDLAAGKRAFSYPVPRQGRIKTYTFQVLGRETITVGAKVYKTIKVARTDDQKDKTWLWHAPSLGYLPVRILKDKRRGADTEILLRRVKVAPAPPTPAQPVISVPAETRPEAAVRPASTPTPTPPVAPPIPTGTKSAANPSARPEPVIERKVETPSPQRKPVPPMQTASGTPEALTPVAAPVLVSVVPRAVPQTAGARPNEIAGSPAETARPVSVSQVVSSPPIESVIEPAVRRGCPAPRRVGKAWLWVRSSVGQECPGKLTRTR